MKNLHFDQPTLHEYGEQALDRRLHYPELALEPGVGGEAALTGVQIANITKELREMAITISANLWNTKLG
jgi:hypothetical protein